MEATAVKEHGMPFAERLVKAFLDGRKTQTRRPIKPQPSAYAGGVHPHHVGRMTLKPAPYLDAYCNARKTIDNPRGMSEHWCWWTEDDRQGPEWIQCPYGKPGDTIYVKERWSPSYTGHEGFPIHYRADLPADPSDALTADHSFGLMRWQEAESMTPEQSRLRFVLANIRIERAGEISDSDCFAEGIKHARDIEGYGLLPRKDFGSDVVAPRYAFSKLWNEHYGDTEYAWEHNPWVWVLDLKPVTPPPQH